MNKYFLYSPNMGYETYSTIEARDAAAKEEIETYLDDGWSEEVTSVCVGEVTGVARQTDVQPKPERKDYDSEDEYDDAICNWGGDPMYDSICNYEIGPL